MTQRSICAATGRPKATVSRVLQAYYREGRICDAPRASVGRKTTATEDQLIVGAASENPFLSAREIRDEAGVGNVSVSTIRRRLHEAGLITRSLRKGTAGAAPSGPANGVRIGRRVLDAGKLACGRIYGRGFFLYPLESRKESLASTS